MTLTFSYFTTTVALLLFHKQKDVQWMWTIWFLKVFQEASLCCYVLIALSIRVPRTVVLERVGKFLPLWPPLTYVRWRLKNSWNITKFWKMCRSHFINHIFENVWGQVQTKKFFGEIFHQMTSEIPGISLILENAASF